MAFSIRNVVWHNGSQADDRRGPSLQGAWWRRRLREFVLTLAPIFVFVFSQVPHLHSTIMTMAGGEDGAEQGTTEHSSSRNDHKSPTPFAHSREFQIGGYWGVPYTHRADVELKRAPDTDLVSKGVGWDGLPAKSPIYYGWRLTQWMGPSPVGGMIDFTHNKTLARKQEVLEMKGRFRGKTITEPTKLNDIYKKLELSHGHNTLLATGLLRLPFMQSSASPYVGVGAGIAIPHFEVHLEGDDTRTYEYQWVGLAGQVLGGLEFRVAEKVSLYLEYKLVFAPVRGTLKSDGGGFLNINLWSHQIIGGVNFRFAQPKKG